MPRLLRYLDPRRSLAMAIGWLVVALSLVLALVAAFWMGGMARTSLLHQHGRQLATTTDQFAAELDQALSSRLQSVRATAALLGTAAGIENPRARRALLDELQSAYPEFDWIGLADTKGTVMAAAAGLFEGGSLVSHPGFASGLLGPWIGDIQDVTPLKRRIALPPGHKAGRFVALMAPVRNPQGRVVGVVDAHLDTGWMRNYAGGLNETLQLPRTTQTLVVDGEGLILIGPDSLQGKRWHGAPLRDAAFIHATTALERLEDGRVVLVSRAESAAGSPLRTLGWHVQLVEPAERAYRNANALWLHILWVSLGLAGAAGLLGVLITRHLTQRLTALTHSVQDVGKGRVQHVEVPAGVDEVAQVGGAFAEVLDALQRERGELRKLSAELEQRVATRTREIERLGEEARYAAVVRERLKIARDLHDTLAHSMMAMLAEVRLLKKLHVHDPAALSGELAHAEQVAHQGLKAARAAIAQTRFNAVRDVGLGAALADAIKRFAERTGLTVDYSAEPNAAGLADERAETLFRIVEEALRNVERHAMASRVAVRLHDAPDGCLALSIEDEGVGFDTSVQHPGHYGLVGLREQAQLIGAELNIRSAPQAGTSLLLSLRLSPDLH